MVKQVHLFKFSILFLFDGWILQNPYQLFVCRITFSHHVITITNWNPVVITPFCCEREKKETQKKRKKKTLQYRRMNCYINIFVFPEFLDIWQINISWFYNRTFFSPLPWYTYIVWKRSKQHLSCAHIRSNSMR